MNNSIYNEFVNLQKDTAELLNELTDKETDKALKARTENIKMRTESLVTELTAAALDAEKVFNLFDAFQHDLGLQNSNIDEKTRLNFECNFNHHSVMSFVILDYIVKVHKALNLEQDAPVYVQGQS